MKVLAIDQGTTSTRALVIDEAGSIQSVVSRPHRQIYPRSGWVEHDPEELVASIWACLDACGNIDDLCAVGIGNQGESCLAWDASSGRAITPVIVWQDDRTSDDIERLRQQGVEKLVLDRAGLPLDPYFSASKFSWIMREIPEAKDLAERGTLRLGTTDAFFLDRLTGHFQTDVSTASRTSLMNLEHCQWDEELCRLFGVPISALPRIVPTTGDFGAVQCGSRLVPLSASIVDQQASLYGHGCRNPGDAKITFGTGAFALTVTGTLKRPRAGGPLPTIAWQKSGAAPTYALDGGIYSASAAVNWARGAGLFDDFSEIATFTAEPAITRGIVFVPALSGLACPHWDRKARGAWLGLALDTSPVDMMQALLEGVAFRTAEVLSAMTDIQVLNAPVSIDGGMAANAYFNQFLSNVLDRNIIVSSEHELTAIGTASLAAEAVGRPLRIGKAGSQITPHACPDTYLHRFIRARTLVQKFGETV